MMKADDEGGQLLLDGREKTYEHEMVSLQSTSREERRPADFRLTFCR